MVPFKETINTKQELIEACKKGYEDYSKRIISKNDFCMYFGFTHGEAITKFYKGKYEQLLIDGGFNSGSSAYFSAGINAWKNLQDGKYEFPPLVQKEINPHIEYKKSLQQIFYGAPGTGKSHTIKEEENILDKDNIFRTTFHPDSDYASFVGTYKPTMSEVDTKVVPIVFSDKGTTFEKDRTIKENKIVYEFVPQVFLKAYIRAWQIWRGTTPSSETPKSVTESTTFGEIKVTIDGAIICEGKTMAESGFVLVEEYIKTKESATTEDIVNEWNNGIGIGSPDFRLLNEDADITKKTTWPNIDINGEKYLFVKEIHGKLWKDFCDNVKKLFEQFGKVVVIEDTEKLRKKKASDASLESPEESILQTTLLVIEEINRGNCAQIFGDIFQLLDRGNDDFSEYPIVPDKDINDFVKKEFERLSVSFSDEQINSINKHFDNKDVATEILNGKVLVLPPNLYIWATMNTSDQSLFPIDSAFKRRWDWKYIPIDTQKESWCISVNGTNYDWSDFLEKINAKIESATSSEDKMLGFYFCKAENGVISAEKFVNKVLFYLWNDVFKDYGFDDAVFNDKNNKKITFRMFYKADGKVDETITWKFLENLQVSGTGGNHDEDDDEKAAGVSEKQLRFWEGFNKARESHDEYSKIYTEKKPLAQQWMDLAFGTSAYYPSLSVVFTKSVVRVLIWISGSNRSAEIFEHFKENESALNEITGVNLDFKESKTSYSIIAERSINVNDESTWNEAYEWMMSMAIKMKSIKDRFGI